MSDPITPDQQGAGVVTSPAESMTQGGLLDALRSRGTLPAMLPPQMLAQSMQQEGPGPSGGLAVGSGMLNALSGGNAAQNPYLQQYQAQQNAQVEQSLKYQQLQQQQQTARDKQDELARTILKDTLFGPNAVEDPAARGPLAKQYAGMVGQKVGMPMPEGVLRSWSRGGPSMESQKKLAILLGTADAETDPDIQKSLQRDAFTFYREHGGNPAEFDKTAAMLRNPLYRKAAGLPDNESLQKEQLDLQEKFRKRWVDTHPAFADVKDEKGHTVMGGVTGYADEIVRKITGRSLFDLKDDNPADAALIQAALEGARAKAKSNLQRQMELTLEQDQVKEQQKSDIIERRQKSVLAERAKLFPPKPVGTMNQKAAEQALQPLTDAENAVSDLAMLNGALERAAKKGLVPSETGVLAAWKARAAQAWNYNDPDILTIKQTILPMIIGKIDRGLFDEKNVRFKQAFEEQMKIAQSLPTVEAFKKLSDMYAYMFARNAARRVYNLESLEGQRNPEVVNLAKDAFRTLYPNGMPGDPTLLPPGSHYEYRDMRPVIVSDDGKFMKSPEGPWVPKK